MPIHAYRCACGKQADVLVRSGREPMTCDEASAFGCMAEPPGDLTRMVSAGHVGASGPGVRQRETEAGNCGHCGMTPGSCDTVN